MAEVILDATDFSPNEGEEILVIATAKVSSAQDTARNFNYRAWVDGQEVRTCKDTGFIDPGEEILIFEEHFTFQELGEHTIEIKMWDAWLDCDSQNQNAISDQDSITIDVQKQPPDGEITSISVNGQDVL
ncbi:MAG: hypothetical protein ABEJ66_01120 [Candidatus Nanohaloarchaea archaeon]